MVCDADLSKEDLRGTMLSEVIAASYDGTGLWVALAVAVSLPALVGGLLGFLVGAILGAALGAKGLPDAGALVGAILFGLFSVWKLIRLRAQERAHSRDSS